MNVIREWLVRRKLSSPEALVRKRAVLDLCYDKDPGALPLFTLVIDDGDYEIADYAASGIARLATPAALETLAAAVRRQLIGRAMPKPDRDYSMTVHKLVSSLRAFGPAAGSTLIAVLENREAEIVAGDQGPSWAAEVAAAILGDIAFTPAANALLARLADPRQHLRAAAAVALGKLKHKPAIDRLVPMLSDQESAVRAAAANALEALSWRPSDAAKRAEFALLMDDIPAAAREGAAAVAPILAKIASAPHSNDPRYLMQYELMQSLAKALEQILDQHGASISRADLERLAKLGDERVGYVAEYIRENYASGAEYTERVPTETKYDFGTLRERAGKLLRGNAPANPQ